MIKWVFNGAEKYQLLSFKVVGKFFEYFTFVASTAYFISKIVLYIANTN